MTNKPAGHLGGTRDIMTETPAVITGEMHMDEGTNLISKHGVTGLPVVDKKNILVGFLSQKDCMKYMLEMKHDENSLSSVKDYMAKSIVTFKVSDTLFFMMEVFIKNNFQSYPVVDSKGELQGIIARTTLFKVLNKMNQTNWFDVI